MPILCHTVRSQIYSSQDDETVDTDSAVIQDTGWSVVIYLFVYANN